MKILVLEPYFGGSHRAFLRDLARYLPVEFVMLTLPARKWKWRMRLAAAYFVEKIKQLPAPGDYDCILCSTFVDVAAFRGLAPPPFNQIPLLTYFHENQFAYPVQVEDERDFHFALTNYTTALASDSLAFNSEYNLESFINGVNKLLKTAPDMKLGDQEGVIRGRSRILHPGIDFTPIDKAPSTGRHDCPVIVWNHRWEHDKGPELFFRTLFEVDRQGVDFRLVVMGESFASQPAIFAEARQRLAGRILHFGYVASRREYVNWLKVGDIVISTALHEFYGISVIEAVRAGCLPLLPNRLSYPGLFPGEFLYEEDTFLSTLCALLRQEARLSDRQAGMLTDRFSWDVMTDKFKAWLSGGESGWASNRTTPAS